MRAQSPSEQTIEAGILRMVQAIDSRSRTSREAENDVSGFDKEDNGVTPAAMER